MFVDAAARCRDVILENLRHLGFEERASVVTGDAAATVRSLGQRAERFDLVFLDPPYGKGLLVPVLEAVEASGVAAPGALVVAEHAARDEVPSQVGVLVLRDRRRYGDTVLSFYEAVGREPAHPGETSSG